MTEDRLTPVSPAQAAAIALADYGLAGSAQRLASEHDDTFRLTGADGVDRLLKISAAPSPVAGVSVLPLPASPGVTAGDGPGFQTALLLHLERVAPELPVQRVIPTLDGQPELTLTHGPGERRLVRLTSWLDGELLGRGVSSAGLRREIGATLARLNIALRGFAHPGARRTHEWDLQNFSSLRPLLDTLPASAMLPSVSHALAVSALATGRAAVGGLPTGRLAGPGVAEGGLVAEGLRELIAGGLRAALAECLDRFDAVVRPALAGGPTQVVHTDFHGENLLTDGRRITGILDFGDALLGPVAMDVGVAACYQLGGYGVDGYGVDGLGDARGDVLGPALDVVAGYHAIDPLSPAELDLVGEFIAARVATRIIVSQANAVREPANSGYLLRRTSAAIVQFAALRALPPGEIGRRLRVACLVDEVKEDVQ